MAVKTFTTGEVLTAADTNTYLNNGGLVYITFSTFSAATAPAFEGCFSSTYAHYLITYNMTTSITGQYTGLRLRAGGVSKATNYNRANYVITTASGFAADNSNTAQTEWVGGTQSTTLLSGHIYLYNPQLSGPTGMNWVGSYPTGTYYASGQQTDTYQADGFSIFASGNAATYTGTIRVYGIRQA